MNTRALSWVVCILLVSFALTTGSSRKSDALARPRSEQESTLPISTTFVGTYSRNDPPTSVQRSFQWEGQAYDDDAIVDVLMKVILNRQTGASHRRRALSLLEVLEHELQGRDCIDQLLTLYSEFTDHSEKAAILACLSASEDPRALPTFSKVLEKEEDKVMRLFAASGLARWNIRAGVEELLALLQCHVHLPGRRNRTVKAEASFMLMGLNGPKGWGFPRREVAKPAGVGGKAKWFTMVPKDCNDWFKANKDRFPDWKPGDPLPAVSRSDGEKSRGE